MTQPKLSALSSDVTRRLDDLQGALVEICGSNLVALVVHGSAVRGGWREGVSDVDVIIVLNSDEESLLEKLGPVLELARFSARIEAMILVASEIPRSADCFPLFYGDVARASVTLVGQSPFAQLTIHDHHKRVRIEQELREIRIRMRRVVADTAGHKNFGGALERKIKQARVPLYELLVLRGTPPADNLTAVLRDAGTAYAIDIAPLERAHIDPALAFQCLAKLLDAALADVDSRERKE
ncbi:MAG: nucleotidyltransferase domain-containing protein [Kofleriaceae bacterium]